jgi:hypothetical protein
VGADLDVMTAPLTYVYCLVSNRTPPSTTRRPKGPAGLGRVRLVPLENRLWAVVADAPADAYNEHAINDRLGDLDWVSRAAVAHEAVIESFAGASAVLPMKLFTLFTSDARAVEDLRKQRPHIDAALKRVSGHDEWGIRVTLDRARAVSGAGHVPRRATTTGAGYLQRKKAQRDAGVELAARAREVIADLYDRLAAEATLARRRAASELPAQGGPLLLDAAFLVRRSRARRFRSRAAAQAKQLAPNGYAVSLSGPWPPYTFVQD